MARSVIFCLSAIFQSVFLASFHSSALAVAASIQPLSEALPKRQNAASPISEESEQINANSSSVQHFLILGDGSQIIPIDSPKPDPGTLARLSVNGDGHLYTFSIDNHHGDKPFPSPAFSKYLFDCVFQLFKQVPRGGEGAQSPYPDGRYACNLSQLPGMVRVDLVPNTIDYKMAYDDLAFVLKVLHDEEAIKKETWFFDFEFNYTPDQKTTPDLQRVMNGQWVKAPRPGNLAIN